MEYVGSVKLFQEEAEGRVIVQQLLEPAFRALVKLGSYAATLEHVNYYVLSAEANFYLFVQMILIKT